MNPPAGKEARATYDPADDALRLDSCPSGKIGGLFVNQSGGLHEPFQFGHGANLELAGDGCAVKLHHPLADVHVGSNLLVKPTVDDMAQDDEFTTGMRIDSATGKPN